MNKVRPRPRRGTLSFVLVFPVELVAPLPLVPDEDVPLGFGWRRLGLAVGGVLVPESFADALGREVINAPLTSSSCCANAIAGTNSAPTINKLRKLNFILIARTSPSTKPHYWCCIRISKTTGVSGLSGLATFTVTKGAEASLVSSSVIGSLFLFFA